MQETARTVLQHTAHVYDAGARRVVPDSKAEHKPAVDSARDELAAS